MQIQQEGIDKILRHAKRVVLETRRKQGSYDDARPPLEQLGLAAMRGIRFRRDGSKYFGQCAPESEIREGWGIAVSSLGTNLYEGYWKDDLSHGKGRLICDSGRIIEGNWV